MPTMTKPKNRKADQPGKSKKSKLTAATADRYDLYLQSVQDPEVEVAFFDRVYREYRHKTAKLLHEDFCAAFAVCCEWVKSDDAREAIGVDLDPEPLQWGRDHLAAKLTDEQRRRIELLEADVRTPLERKADVLAAQNFSFFGLTTRAELRDYFRAARANLAEDGLMVLDMMGGSECFLEDREEVTRKKGFKYVWEQSRFDPITHFTRFHIHFRFKDGTEMTNAFSYEWRLWTMPEVIELLNEAGFSKVDVHWEGTDEDGEGDGDFRVRDHVDADPAWVAYVVALK